MKKVMKHFNYPVSALALCLLFAASCSKSNPEPPVSISVQAAMVRLPATDGTQTIGVTTNASEWTASRA
jgi:hypothetical protein